MDPVQLVLQRVDEDDVVGIGRVARRFLSRRYRRQLRCGEGDSGQTEQHTTGNRIQGKADKTHKDSALRSKMTVNDGKLPQQCDRGRIRIPATSN